MTRMPFKHILVPVELGRGPHRAVAVAGALAAQSSARLTLLHVIQKIEHLPASELQPFYVRLGARARQALGRAARGVAHTGVRVHTANVVGDPAREIVRFATRARVDLIVLGSHAVDPRGRTRGWGTTSYKVGLLCRCPVLLVK